MTGFAWKVRVTSQMPTTTGSLSGQDEDAEDSATMGEFPTYAGGRTAYRFSAARFASLSLQ